MERSSDEVATATSNATVEWQRRLDTVKIPKPDLNRVILNFFIVEGFQEAAEAFCRETRMEPDIDLKSIEDRKKVRSAITSGDIERAIAQLDSINPEILAKNEGLHFDMMNHALIERIKAAGSDMDNIMDAMKFAEEEVGPRARNDPERLRRVEETMGILAFPDAADSPSSHLLLPAQRQLVASQVNGAILASQCQHKESRLPLLVKRLIHSQDKLQEKVSFPRVVVAEGGNRNKDGLVTGDFDISAMHILGAAADRGRSPVAPPP